MNKPITLSCLSLIVLGSTLVSCSTESKQQKRGYETFKVVQPIVVDTTFEREYIAELQSLQNVEIRTHVQGFIEKIHVDEGKPVKEGQILFTLSSRGFRENLIKANAAYKSAVADLKVAEVSLKNTKTLADKNIVSKSELEMAQARKEAAEAKLEEARSAVSIAKLNLSYTQVRAPFTGVINRIPYKTGSLVSEGDLLTTISNNNEIFAYFNVSEKEFLDMMKSSDMKNSEVKLLMANNQLFNHKGKIETAENEIDRGTGNIAFRARFKNPEKILKHGSSGKILLEEDLEDAMIIPQKATFEIQDKVYVFTIDKSNKVKMRNINPSLRLNHLYVVESGLDTGDRVIYEGIQQVKEGDQINAQVITMRDALTN
jgi:RND family efflux transporter MFP subunit